MYFSRVVYPSLSSPSTCNLRFIRYKEYSSLFLWYHSRFFDFFRLGQSNSVLKNTLTSVTGFNIMTFVLIETTDKKRLLIVMSSDIIPFALGNIDR